MSPSPFILSKGNINTFACYLPYTVTKIILHYIYVVFAWIIEFEKAPEDINIVREKSMTVTASRIIITDDFTIFLFPNVKSCSNSVRKMHLGTHH